MMSDQELKQLLEPIARKWLRPFGFRFAEVISNVDHDGDRSIFITAHYDNRDDEIDPDAVLSAIGEMQAALEAGGDQRFPYLKHDVPSLAAIHETG